MTSPNPPTTPTCLGILLGAREVGVAVATREHLLHDGVVNLRKLTSREGREARFRQAMAARLDRFPVTRVAVTRPLGVLHDPGLVDAERAWLADECRRRGLALHAYDTRAVRADPASAGRLRTHRVLAEQLAARFPELAGKCPTYRTTPASGVPARARYWFRMFLALATALCDLDRALLNRLDS